MKFYANALNELANRKLRFTILIVKKKFLKIEKNIATS